MWHHFWDVADARDAVIAGNVEGVRAPLQRIAAGQYGVEEIPYDWLPWIEEMQAEAKRGASAKSLQEAAQAVAAVAQRCGDCHRATRGGPEMEDDVAAFDAHGRTGLKGEMAQHVWAAEELWLGMTVPHHQSWASGAKALAETPLPPPADKAMADTSEPARDKRDRAGAKLATGAPAATEVTPTEPAVDNGMRAKLEAVHELGDRALQAGQPAEMTAVYAEMMARCGACHAALGGPSRGFGPH